MFIYTNVYFRRLIEVLENVIAPEVESDHARGQVFAVVDLISQISEWVEYKHKLVDEDIELGSNMTRKLVAAVEEAGGETPGEIQTFLKEFEEGKAGKELALRKKVEETLCTAIDHFHDSLGKMKPDVASKLDTELRQYFFKNAGRDLGFMKPPKIEKISRPEKYKRSKA